MRQQGRKGLKNSENKPWKKKLGRKRKHGDKNSERKKIEPENMETIR